MSIIATVELEIKDLQAVDRACKRLGLEFRRGQKTFRQHLSHGNTGCDHAISVPGNSQAYEIGMISKKKGVYELRFDHWQGGHGLMAKVASDKKRLNDVNLFRQAYAAEVAIGEFRRAGYRYRETTDEKGCIMLEAFVAS